MKSKEVFEYHEMIFRVKEKEDSSIEVLKFCSNGDVYIKGEKVDSNKEIYTTFKKWLHKALDEVNLPQVIINNEKYKFE